MLALSHRSLTLSDPSRNPGHSRAPPEQLATRHGPPLANSISPLEDFYTEMEGYLLALRKDREAQLWFCVLEHGVLRCFAKPGGAPVASVQLTRHSVRVVVHSDGVCPNEFAVGTTEVHFDEARAKLRLNPAKEKTHRFAAPTPEKMRRWGRAIQNWKRYAFSEPVQTVADKETTSARKAALREEAQQLISFVTSFDLRLKLAVPKDSGDTAKRKKGLRSSLVSAKSASDAKSNRMSLPTARVAQLPSLTSWIPPVRVPSLRRMWSSPTTDS